MVGVDNRKAKLIAYWFILNFSVNPTVYMLNRTITFSVKERITKPFAMPLILYHLLKYYCIFYYRVEDVVRSYDLDCCCVMFHNGHVLLSVRGLQALMTIKNFISALPGVPAHCQELRNIGYAVFK